MDWQRTVLLGAMGVVVWLLVIQWTQFEEAHSPVVSRETSEVIIPSDNLLPEVVEADELPEIVSLEKVESASPLVDSRLVTVTTDVLEVVIDTLGGDIVQINLREHLTKMKDEGGEPFTLLIRSSTNTYVAQSGLVGANGTDKKGRRPRFTVASDNFELLKEDDQLAVDLHTEQQGVKIVKRFVFTPGDYQIGVQYLIDNMTSEPWSAVFYGQIKRDSLSPVVESVGVSPYLGAALRTEDKNYDKYDFGDMEDESVKSSFTGGWVAMVQHYFISAWVPPQDDINHYSLRKLSGRDIYLMGYTSPPIEIASGESGQYKTQFYAGPKDQGKLAELADYLDLTIDYGFLWMLAKPIFAALQIIYAWVGNWGWAIILLTVSIKILLYPLSAASLRSMAKMRKLQPEMQRLKDLYGDDRQKMSQELMGLYKKEKVNPAGGCLPVLLQMPVFISLYWVLLESVEIRHASWVLWVQDLSAKDPYFILPLIMGGSMFLMQKMQPTPPDPTQAKIMQIMPIAFTFFFMLFPAGLVLYWTVNNVLSILQQWYVNRQLNAG